MKSYGKAPRRKKNIFTLFFLKKKKRSYETRLNRVSSPWRILVGPIISVLLASLITTLPIFSHGPLLPPFGFMVFIAWRFLRPGMWPMWAGLPFGIFDDIFSGAMMGSAALTWSIAMLIAEFIDSRIIWRDYILDWIVASLFISAYLFAGIFILGLAQIYINALIIIPQIIISIFLYPLTVRFCASIDYWRLRR